MSQPQPANPFIEKPVNFGSEYDDPYASTEHDNNFDRATTGTHYTTGVVADDPSHFTNERGETRAQELANSYRSTTSANRPPLPSSRRGSKAHRPNAPSVAASRMTDLTYIDENFVRAHYLHLPSLNMRRNTTQRGRLAATTIPPRP